MKTIKKIHQWQKRNEAKFLLITIITCGAFFLLCERLITAGINIPIVVIDTIGIISCTVILLVFLFNVFMHAYERTLKR